MEHTTVGILHPGAMGISVAAAARSGGKTVLWASDGRSAETRGRADAHDLTDCNSVAQMAARCDIILSVCPPHAALDVAVSVRDTGYQGIFVDANAIAPQKMVAIAEMLTPAGIVVVDGSIVGGPAWKPGTTWLHLAGPSAAAVAAVFANGPLETTIHDAPVGAASALKMCFAAYTKGTSALLATILAGAEALGVQDVLAAQWSQYYGDMHEQTQLRTQRVTQKAWRFAGEMEEMAATFAGVNLPAGFFTAAADVYSRMAHFKGMDALPALDAVIAAISDSRK